MPYNYLEVKTSKSEIILIHQIAERAQKEVFSHIIIISLSDIIMDLELTHANYPLDLERFRRAKKFDFTHDIIGIYQNLDRKTGKLKNFFEPRYSLKSHRGDAI
jgi:hypothetical protein